MELDRARAGVVTSNTTTGIAGQEERPYSNVIEVLFLLSLASRNALFQNKINKYTGISWQLPSRILSELNNAMRLSFLSVLLDPYLIRIPIYALFLVWNRIQANKTTES